MQYIHTYFSIYMHTHTYTYVYILIHHFAQGLPNLASLSGSRLETGFASMLSPPIVMAIGAAALSVLFS